MTHPKFRNEACMMLRYAYPEEFEGIIKRLSETTAIPRKRCHRPALQMLRLNHLAECDVIQAKLRAEAGPVINLVKKPAVSPSTGLRSRMDPEDAMILLKRGLTLPEIAEHDGCTQTAVIEALVPQARMGIEALAEQLGLNDSRFIRRVMRNKGIEAPKKPPRIGLTYDASNPVGAAQHTRAVMLKGEQRW